MPPIMPEPQVKRQFPPTDGAAPQKAMAEAKPVITAFPGRS
jgi:hypothetical protein